MKKYLNKIIIIISLIILSLIALKYFNNDSETLEAKVNNLKEISTPRIIEISNPVFKNKGLNTNYYEIIAKKGVQINNDIEIYEVFGKFTNDKGDLIYIKADKGLYSQSIQVIELTGNVLIYDDLENKTSTDNALIDIANKTINLSDNVISISDTSTIKSNSSIVDEKNNTLTYTGNVKVKIKD